MPRLDNTRRELFAQGLAKGLVPEAAYAAASYKPHRQNAHRMMTEDDVKARVAELHADVAGASKVDLKRVLEEMERIAFAKITDAVNWSGAVVKIETKETENGETTEITLRSVLLRDRGRARFMGGIGGRTSRSG